MPTDLEMRLLSNLIHGMDIGELRGLVMHVAEREFEVVGAAALRIKEDRGEFESYTLSDDQPEDDSAMGCRPRPTSHRLEGHREQRRVQQCGWSQSFCVHHDRVKRRREMPPAPETSVPSNVVELGLETVQEE